MKARARARTIILREAREPKDLEPQFESFAGLEDRHDDAQPFRLVDSFDGSIRRSGRALIEAGGRLLLVGGSVGAGRGRRARRSATISASSTKSARPWPG
jgi:hypothetical protein